MEKQHDSGGIAEKAWTSAGENFATDFSSTSPSIQQLFEVQAEYSPDSIALIDGTRQVTYRELDESSNRLAHYLIGAGVCRGMAVGTLMERSTETVVALLAVLKSGAVYVPMDTTHPSA